jgi:hypothetical protein
MPAVSVGRGEAQGMSKISRAKSVVHLLIAVVRLSSFRLSLTMMNGKHAKFLENLFFAPFNTEKIVSLNK